MFKSFFYVATMLLNVHWHFYFVSVDTQINRKQTYLSYPVKPTVSLHQDKMAVLCMAPCNLHL